MNHYDSLSHGGKELERGFHPHLDHLPSKEVAKVQRQADILFLPLAFDSPIPEVIRTSAPGKMSEYLGGGRPILAHSPADSFVTYYLRQHECGLVVDKPNATLLADAIRRILLDPHLRASLVSNAQRQAEVDFAPSISQARFHEVLQRRSKDK